MTYIKTFDCISKMDVNIAGGKGASLGEMVQAGLRVPAGYIVLAKAFDHFLTETNLKVEIDAVLDTVDVDEIHTVEHAAEKIQTLVLTKEIPKSITVPIINHFNTLNSEFVAIRSSATSEDSATAAWAGQLESYLNTKEKTLLQNIKKCWASLFSPRAIFYRFEKGLHLENISVAVIVQKMIQSEKSGIAFSVHPITEDTNQIIIEAGFGLGEAIVSGMVTPDNYVINKSDREIIEITVNTQIKALYRRANGGNKWKILGKKGREQVLTEAQIKELASMIIKIEKHYGFPCDIEWAEEKNHFYIVQSRPITTLRSVPKTSV